MAITDISISEELQTNAPSIRYSGDEGPKSPQEMEQMMAGMMDQIALDFEMQHGYDISLASPEMREGFIQKWKEENFYDDFSRGPVLPSPEDPVNPFQPKPQGPVLPDRQMAAYGGIMGLDGRKQYGIGSWFQEKIMDPIKENPLLTAAAAALGYNTYQNTGTRGDFEDSILGKGIKALTTKRPSGEFYPPGHPKAGQEIEGTSVLGDITSGLTRNIIPIVGGLGAGLFTQNQPEQPGLPDDTTGIQLADLKKSANILDQKQGMAAGLNFLPAVAARKYTPAEMIETYAKAANGGRIGFDNGGIMMASAPSLEDSRNEMSLMLFGKPLHELTDEELEILNESSKRKPMDKLNIKMAGGIEMDANNEIMESIIDDLMEANPSLSIEEAIEEAKKIFDQMASKPMNRPRVMAQEGGLMDLGGMEKDYRAEGGFVPIGREEKADDVPARLSVNEFVFTADAVRNAGGGDIDQGAKVMENMMKHLEAGGQVSEESQGMAGARDMFEVSERLSEVV